MLAMSRLDDGFLDRPGCGDELYLDSRFKAAAWLAGLPLDDDAELDFTDDAGDEPAGH